MAETKIIINLNDNELFSVFIYNINRLEKHLKMFPFLLYGIHG